MVTVKDCLSHKSNQVISVASGAMVRAALTLMRDNKVRSILVIDNDQLSGIVTQGDCAIKVLLQGLDAGQVPVESIMTKNLISVSLADSLDRCMGVMVAKHIRHLPVLDDGKVVGVVSIGDVVKNIMDQQGTQINFLETYIKGHGVG